MEKLILDLLDGKNLENRTFVMLHGEIRKIYQSNQKGQRRGQEMMKAKKKKSKIFRMSSRKVSVHGD
jgi:hypothetical protein